MFFNTLLCVTILGYSCQSIFAMPEDWQLRVDSLNAFYAPTDLLPIDNETGYPQIYLPLIGNGYLSHSKGVRSDTMYVSGVFNNETTSPSHRAQIPAAFAITITEESTLGALLDIEYGIYYRRGVTTCASYELRWYAHRSLRYLYVMEIQPTLAAGFVTCDLEISNDIDMLQSADITFAVVDSGMPTVSLMCGETTIPETDGGETPTVCVAYTPLPTHYAVNSINDGVTATYITAIRTSLDTEMDMIGESAVDELENGLSLASTNELQSMHVDAWKDLWTHGISIHGRTDVAIAINASLFAILSSVRSDWPYGLAPGGLTNYYNGHSFWDTETWMYPPLLLLHSDIAQSLIQYRYDRLDGARQKAKSYTPPFAGTMFPWESAFSGVETCPIWAPTGLREQHISADISLAVWQYWLTQKDEDWLRNTGYEILSGVAEFLVSKIIYYPATKESAAVAYIHDVIPPDEYVDHVNNSIYTNYGAALALRIAADASDYLSIPYSSSYREIANAIVLPLDDETQIHPEYDGYDWGTIKQADVVLLHFPLEMEMSYESQVADLDFYSQVTDINGPAMTWGMHSIGYRDLLRFDTAAQYLNLSFQDNLQSPFNVWTETPSGNAGNFVTGAGGFLQTVIAGYAGIRQSYKAEQLSISSVCAQGSKGMSLRGISYLRSEFDISYECADDNYPVYPTSITIKMTQNSDYFKLYLMVSESSDRITLELNTEVIVTLAPEDAAVDGPATLIIVGEPTTATKPNEMSQVKLGLLITVSVLFCLTIAGCIGWVFFKKCTASDPYAYKLASEQ